MTPSLRRMGIGVLIAVAMAFCNVTNFANANAPIYSFSAQPSFTQAGGHADLRVDFEAGTFETEPPIPCGCNVLRQAIANLPAGVFGSPGDIPKCNTTQFSERKCPVDSQIGIVAFVIFGPAGQQSVAPLYNMVPRPGQVALVAFPTPLIGTPIYTSFTVRTESDYGLETKTIGVPSGFPVAHLTQYIWGVPADSSHDVLRSPFDGWGPPGAGVYSRAISCTSNDPRSALDHNEFPAEQCPEFAGDPPTPSSSPPTPFLSNPTQCGVRSESSLRVDSYDLGTDFASAPYPAATGCDQLAFDPSLSAKPTTTAADTPSGLDINLHVPQTLSASTPSPSAIRGATVRLPDGFTISAGAADGKASCSDADARFGTRNAAKCPDFSKVGTLSIRSSALPAALPGAIYLGKPLPTERYRLFLIADGFSLHIKLPGTVHPDPQTGQVVVSFVDLPQAPFEDFDMHFFGSERGLLTTPIRCGTYPVLSEFTPWAAVLPVQTSTQFFRVSSGPDGEPCPGTPREFAPTVTAGVTDNTGGAHTGFSFDLVRPDGEQYLTSVDVATPPGFSATIAAVPYCDEQALAAVAGADYAGLGELALPICPASQVGVSSASVGAGTRPTTLAGKVYLAGPYKGAPLSLAIVNPAVSGPYDLGNVVVRVALEVDPETAAITSISDPLPRIVGGIPLRLRRVVVEFNRPGFAINPTNCNPLAVDTTVLGSEGGKVERRTHFQVANCGALPYGPQLRLRLSGGLNRRGHPVIQAVFTARRGEANTHSVSVTLPKGELLDNRHIGTVCTRTAFANGNCPRSSRIGVAEARTPLLAQPLRGNVYLRTSSQDLPDMVADLRGQIGVNLVGHIDSVNARLRTTFAAVPDVPVSEFRLDLAGGSKGLLINSEGLCAKKKRAYARMAGQNGRVTTSRPRLEVRCGRSARPEKAS